MPLNQEDFEGLFTAWRKESDAIFKLFQQKHGSYGPDNISATGKIGVAVRLWDKVNRLRRGIVLGEIEHLDDETLEDTFQDVVNYGIIGLLLLHGVWPKFTGGGNSNENCYRNQD